MKKSRICCLKDIISEHASAPLQKRGNLYYYGDISEYTSDPVPNETAVLLEKDGTHAGYAYVHSGKPFHNILYHTDCENISIDVYDSKIVLHVQPYQVTARPPVHPQAIVKEDWVTPSPFTIEMPGNYKIHRTLLEGAVTTFGRNGKTQLLLPSFFQ